MHISIFLLKDVLIKKNLFLFILLSGDPFIYLFSYLLCMYLNMFMCFTYLSLNLYIFIIKWKKAYTLERNCWTRQLCSLLDKSGNI